MRKITSLLMLFCMCVGMAFAQTLPATDKAFKVENNRGALAINNDGTALIGTPNVAIADVAQKNFAFIQHDGKVYLYSVWASKFVNKDCSLTNSLPVDAITVENVADGKFFFKFDNAHNVNLGGSGQIAVNDWGTKDAGNQFTLVENGDFDPTAALAILDNSCTITYNFTYNGNVVATQVTKINKGANYPAFTSLPWGAVATVPTGTADADETVEIVCTVDTSVLPFVPSATYDDANMKWYYLKNNNTYYLSHKTGQDHIALNDAAKAIDENNKDAFSWAFVGNPFEGYQIVNRATGNTHVLSSSTSVSGNDANVWPVMTETPVPSSNNEYWMATSSSDIENGFYLAQKGFASNRMNNRNGKLAYWTGGADGGSTFTVEERPITVVYNFTYNDKVKYTQETTTFVGEEYPAFTVTLPFGVTGTKPSGKLTTDVDGTTITIELKDNTPFVAAADYASIKNWYYIQMHSTPGYGKYLQDCDTYIEWADAAVDVAVRNTYVWGFIGNPFDGFKLVNYGAGATKGVNSTGSGNPALGEIATATVWQIKPSAVNNDNEHFCFQYPGSNQYMNAQSGKVAFWGSADQGSTMWVTEVDLTGSADLQALIDRVEAAGVADGTTVGYITNESAAAVAEKLTAAKAEIAKDDKTLETVTAAQAALQAAVDNAKTIQPEEGKFYKIVSSCTKDHRAGQSIYVNNTGGMQFANPNEEATDFARVWQFVSAGEGKFYLKNVERGTYLNTAKGHGGGQETALVTETKDAKAITIANMGLANIVSLIPTGGAMMHAQDQGSTVVAWNSIGTSDASAWKIEEVDINTINRQVTVGDAGYSTLVLGYNAVIPTGVEVYTVSNIGNDYVTLSKVTDVLAAGEAVVLKNAGTYNFNYTTEAATEIETNLLEGTVFNTYITGTAYVLSKPEGSEVGLYKAALNKTATGAAPEEGQQGTHFLNNAFKAYLPLPAGSNVQALRFNFGGETTAIDAVEVENANAPIYDLSGRRVLSTVKGGIYIQNGKKFIVK